MELERNEQAASALRRMHEILTAPAPYSLIQEAEALITTVTDVNAALLSERRDLVARSIDAQIALVQQDLASVQHDQTLADGCLGPLQQLKAQIPTQESLAHLSQADTEAVNLKDAALRTIQEYLVDQASQTGVEDKPNIKETQVIKPASLTQQSYLETSEDIERFLEALSKEMNEAIKINKRIEIR